jgi:hypothetical protein
MVSHTIEILEIATSEALLFKSNEVISTLDQEFITGADASVKGTVILLVAALYFKLAQSKIGPYQSDAQ